jgi:hypothetical protein
LGPQLDYYEIIVYNTYIIVTIIWWRVFPTNIQKLDKMLFQKIKKTSIALTATATAAFNIHYLILFNVFPTGIQKHHTLEYISDVSLNEKEVKITSSILLENLVFDFISDIVVVKVNDVWQWNKDSTVHFHATKNGNSSAGFCKMLDGKLQFLNGEYSAASVFEAFINLLHHEAAVV